MIEYPHLKTHRRFNLQQTTCLNSLASRLVTITDRHIEHPIITKKSTSDPWRYGCGCWVWFDLCDGSSSATVALGMLFHGSVIILGALTALLVGTVFRDEPLTTLVVAVVPTGSPCQRCSSIWRRGRPMTWRFDCWRRCGSTCTKNWNRWHPRTWSNDALVILSAL